MSNTELKPCPFCGNSAQCKTGLNRRGDNYVTDVHCTSCNAEMGTYVFSTKLESQSEAVKAWNTRAEQALPNREAELLAEIERLKFHVNALEKDSSHWHKVATASLAYGHELQQQLDSLTVRVKEHNESCLQGCAKTSGDNHCGYGGYDRDCPTCTKDHMIELGNNDE